MIELDSMPTMDSQEFQLRPFPRRITCGNREQGEMPRWGGEKAHWVPSGVFERCQKLHGRGNKQSAWTWQQAIWQFPAVTKVLRHHVAPHGTLQSLHVKSLTLCRYHECSSSPYSLLILFPNCQHLEVLFSDLLVKTRFFPLWPELTISCFQDS